MLYNPFTSYGNIVRGKQFIGRKEAIRLIENRMINSEDSGNLSIVGLPRIGKSSLAFKTIMDCEKEMVNKSIVPIYINVATIPMAEEIFESLVEKSHDKLEDYEMLSHRITKRANEALQKEISWNEKYLRIQRYFEAVKNQEINLIFVLDEFDYARTLFKDRINLFQALRELSYVPTWRISFLALSRRSLIEIETQTGGISNLALIFSTYTLVDFDEKDMDDFFIKIEKTLGVELDTNIKSKIIYYAGGNPFLLSVIGYEVIEQAKEGKAINVEQAVKKNRITFFDYFDRLIELLEEEDLFEPLLELIFGPIEKSSMKDAEKLVMRGIFTDTDEYRVFSTYFQDYLRMLSREADLWPMWKKTETDLRNIIIHKMISQYGEDWISIIEKKKGHLKNMFDQCRANQQKEISAFGAKASTELIEFTYPADLFQIIFAEWDLFKSVFKKNKEYWNQRSTLLSRVRNPMAHNRETVLQKYERKQAEGYCEEICYLIDESMKRIEQ